MNIYLQLLLGRQLYSRQSKFIGILRELLLESGKLATISTSNILQNLAVFNSNILFRACPFFSHRFSKIL